MSPIRRKYFFLLKQLTSCLSALLLFSCLGFAKSVEATPNILMIVIDDLGWKDLSFMGSEYFETPYIDDLAKSGVHFTQAYAGAANCAPSRACLISGRNTPVHHIYTVNPSDRGHEKTRKIIPTPNNDILPLELPNLPQFLKSQGYETAHFGKWHLSEDPMDYGFDFNIAGCHTGSPGSYFRPFTKVKNMPDGPEGEHLTERITAEVIQYLERPKEKPFFLYLPYYTVHTPLQPRPEIHEIWKNKPGAKHKKQIKYGAMVSYMDQQIGLIIEQLEQQGLRENTLIIFTSDNGGIAAISSQTPLRAGKGSYYEGGIRVPLIISWENHIEANSASDEIVSNLDFFPTLIDLITENPKLPELDGVSLLDHLKNRTPLIKRDLIWYFPIYLQAYDPKLDEARDPLFRTRPGAVIRSGDWKLHHYFEDHAFELYNLKTDIGENYNLASEHPEILNGLSQKLDAWYRKNQVPSTFTPNPKYDSEFEAKKIKEALSKTL
ncbi:MAG: sulfatase [Opitutales bacterium]|nr:sulfatase [Opitutales bacterium]